MAARGARDFARSRRHLEQSVALAAANAERGERALALTELAATLKRMREPYNAMRMHAEALTLARASEDERVLGWCLLRGSEMLLFNPERLAGFDQARPLLEESVDLMRSAGDVVGLAFALYWLSHGLMYTNGEYHQARAPLQEVLSYARVLGNPLWIADALAELAVLAEVQGSYADAVRTFDECRSITTGTETPDWGIVRADLGRALWKAGDRARGVQMLRETLVHGRDELRRIQSSLHYMNCLYSLYGLALVAGGEAHRTRAARLYGAATNMRSHQHPIHVVDRTLFEDALLPTHIAMGQVEFEIARAEGAAMTLDEVVAMALADE